MKCAWNELLAILPPRLRSQVDSLGKEGGQNLYLRLGAPPELTRAGKSHWLKGDVTREELNFLINAASRYSPWAAQTITRGYITARGGHRIGICGEGVVKDGRFCGIREVSSVCVRIARDFPGIAAGLGTLRGSVLILGAPGWGKTTLLRDLIRARSDAGVHTAVVDEREELFPPGFPRGRCTEVLSLCPKVQGLDMLLRTMGPETIALDEITAREDWEALEKAAWCGVTLLATVHAVSLGDLLNRSACAPLMKRKLFDTIVVLHKDQSWHVERSLGWDTNGSGRC